eukprot:CAMPEP_0196216492 /NCGR_PEP_ID=MMETSP0912-20130531/32372_1 /TAXON_ID=49265 /ORGANISM="Thalassiosira rotula, Strain GSO102" /LENGTH=39 /DNA_ID= /DNA_START= /DNA_END= /DNA_ORIENTATION=
MVCLAWGISKIYHGASKVCAKFSTGQVQTIDGANNNGFL